MKKLLFPIFLLVLGANVHAQQDLFAITGKDTQSINFNDVRRLDVSNGLSGEKILTADSSVKVFSQARKGIVSENRNSYNNSQSVTMAALAYDPSNNNLVYMPMFSSNIYVLNPQTKEITLIDNNVGRASSCDINSHITRMTTGFDGNIYAVNNSGTQFLQIAKKGGQYIVNDLGTIKDDVSNGKNSFTELQTGFGGDMIADGDNNFYVFAASGNVFKVLTKELKAKFVGKIAGIPDNYSVNGSAINSQGKVVIGSAKGAPMYEVDLTSLEAKQLPGETNLHIYDLASKYFVNDKKTSATGLATLDIYPTRVNDHYINISGTTKDTKGNIKVNIFDMSGKNVITHSMTVKENSVHQKMDIKGLISGAYIVSVTDDAGKILVNKKILVTE